MTTFLRRASMPILAFALSALPFIVSAKPYASTRSNSVSRGIAIRPSLTSTAPPTATQDPLLKPTQEMAHYALLAAIASFLVALTAVGVPMAQRALYNRDKAKRASTDEANSRRELLTIIRYFEALLEPFWAATGDESRLTAGGLDGIVTHVMDRALYTSVPAELVDDTYKTIFNAYGALVRISELQGEIRTARTEYIAGVAAPLTKQMEQQPRSTEKREAGLRAQRNINLDGFLSRIRTLATESSSALSRARVSLEDVEHNPKPAARKA